jgi:hypothetical protein
MKHDNILLVGSIPLEDTAQVFDLVGKSLEGLVSRIPDGETGERLSWLGWQDHVFENNPNLVAEKHEGDHRDATTPKWMKLEKWFKIRDGVNPINIEIGPLKYSENAIASYQIFLKNREEGRMAAKTKFQISIPSPFNLMNSAIKPEHRILVEPQYEARLKLEINQIASEIPSRDLAIQWDCAHDMQAFDNARPVYFDNRYQGIADRLIRIGEWVPTNIELGYHFCYGSLGGKHFVEPKTMGPMVDLANRISSKLNHTLNWIHMPVPIERSDDDYYRALETLKLKPETTLYLGLIHDSDGVEGAAIRIATAEKFRRNFGIATECGFGRRPADSVFPLLNLHKEIASLS